MFKNVLTYFLIEGASWIRKTGYQVQLGNLLVKAPTSQGRPEARAS